MLNPAQNLSDQLLIFTTPGINRKSMAQYRGRIDNPV
jgi:hypothetical protein